MQSHIWRQIKYIVAFALLAIAFSLGSAPNATNASSHREAPLISMDPTADNTDVYAFVSPDNQDTVTLIANFIPMEHPEGGPNYYRFGTDVLYEIHVDNVGDGKSHITFQFRFRTQISNPNTFLYNLGPVSSFADPDLNVRQFYKVTEIIGVGDDIVKRTLANNVPVPPVNVGLKSFPNYPAVLANAVQPLSFTQGAGKVFAGPRDDSFWVDLNVFDLLALRGNPPPIGYANPAANMARDSVAGYNVHTIAIQVPIAHLTRPGDPVIGVWSTASRRALRTFKEEDNDGEKDDGKWVQVSRLGMPLVNEVVIPLALKDTFNGLKPQDDLATYLGVPLLQKSVQDPELGTLLCALYGIPLPRDTNNDCHTEFTTPGTGRSDIFDIFLQGMVTAQPFTIVTANGPVTLPAGFNVNRPLSPSRKPNEVLRLNTAIKGPLCHPTPQRLGLLAGDACGFPNGRRLADDIVEIELLAVGGAAWQVLTGDMSFTINPTIAGVLAAGDNKNYNDVSFSSTFPYAADPHGGTVHTHDVP